MNSQSPRKSGVSKKLRFTRCREAADLGFGLRLLTSFISVHLVFIQSLIRAPGSQESPSQGH